MKRFTTNLKRVWIDIASSLPLNMIWLLFILIAAVFVGNVLFWKVVSIIGVISLCLINFNLNFDYWEKKAITRKRLERVRSAAYKGDQHEKHI